MRLRLVVLVCSSLAIALWPISSSSQDITPADLEILASVFTLVMAAQCFGLWFVGRFSERAADALFVLLMIGNAYCFAFLTVPGGIAVRMPLAIAVGGLAWLILNARVSPAKVGMFTLVFAMLALGQYSYGRMLPPQSAASLRAVHSNRNVYLISTESLHSPYAFRKLYGFDKLDHVSYLESEGFRVFDRAYSVATYTRTSYQRILEFSKRLDNEREMNAVFQLGNSTFKSFRGSGYGVQFIYISNYLNVKHALIDHGFPKMGFYICNNISRHFYYIACRPPVRNLISQVLFDTDSSVSVETEIAHLKKRIRTVAGDTKPWLTISHIAYPNHTRPDYRYENTSDTAAFRELTQSRLQGIADNYREIVGTIKEVDPDAVFVTFGDHGMWLTRGMDTAAPNALFSTQDYIEDRYGVMIGVYPAAFCRERIFEGSSTGQLIKNVIDCLNGNDRPTAEEREQSRMVEYDDRLMTIDGIAAQYAGAP
ncbi:MAG: hypothetical protein WC829_07280 [Hyphomicrobium sp.]